MRTFADLFEYVNTASTDENAYHSLSESCSLHIHPSRKKFEICIKQKDAMKSIAGFSLEGNIVRMHNPGEDNKVNYSHGTMIQKHASVDVYYPLQFGREVKSIILQCLR